MERYAHHASDLSMLSRRVVITGVGMITPLGCKTELVWQRILNGECGIHSLDAASKVSGVDVSVIAKVPRSQRHYGSIEKRDEDYFREETIFGRSVSREMSPFIQYAVAASDLALQHARFPRRSKSDDKLFLGDFDLETYYARDRFGVAISSGGIGSLEDVVEAQRSLDKSFKKLSPYFVPKILTNMAAGHVSIRHGLLGPLHSVATACAAGLHSIGDAFNFIRYGSADAILAGGTESSVDQLTISGFARLKALSSSQDPLRASRPFDTARDGFVIGEGACILVLEELENAKKRNAPIIAEIKGYGLSGDASHITSPSPDGRGAKNCMKMAIRDAGIKASDIGYLNAHATSTPVGDNIELEAIEAVFSERVDMGESRPFIPPLYVSSTKGATGHLLGAAGALEAAFTVLALRDGHLPPTLNLDDVGKQRDLIRHIPKKSIKYNEIVFEDNQRRKLKFAMKNSFGFGGTNASIVFGTMQP